MPLALLHLAPRDGGVAGHAAGEAGLALSGISVGLFHAQDEGVGGLAGVAAVDGVDVAGQQVLRANLQGVALALASAVLARVSVSRRLGVAVGHHFEIYDVVDIGLGQGALKRTSGEVLAPGSLRLVVHFDLDVGVLCRSHCHRYKGDNHAKKQFHHFKIG